MLLTSHLTRHFHLACLLALLAAAAVPHSIAQTNTPAQPRMEQDAATGVASIRWRARPNVNRYRLQLALDNAFSDIVFDRAVIGNTYRVTELPAGRYFWRVAPATTETERYTTVGVIVIAPTDTASRPATPAASATPVAISPATPPARNANVLAPPANSGWNTAIGEAVSLSILNAAPSSNTIVLAANANGTTYALDARRGVALWATRYELSPRRAGASDRAAVGSFAPLAVAGASVANSASSTANRDGVIVAYSEGVRMIEAASGREVWRTPLAGQANGGAIAGVNGDGAAEVIVTTRNPERLYFINRRTGAIERQRQLDGTPVGAPIVVNNAGQAEVLLAFTNGLIAAFNNRDAGAARSIKLDTQITTPPHLPEGASGARLLVGTARGLVALSLPDLRPLWRIATEDDAPRGTLASADLDGDRAAEAVMVTRNGRVAVVDVGRGQIKWAVEGARGAAGAVFADADGNGTLDVFVAADGALATAYSGRDGKIVWSAEDALAASAANRQAAARSSRAPRSLVVVPLASTSGNANSALLVGADPSGVGVRAVRLSQVAGGAANR